MNIKNVLTVICFFIGSTLLGQTKLISHKSHSGSTANFSLALEKNLFDLKDSNFGVAPMREIKTANLDSLIFLTDTSVIMVTSETCSIVDRDVPKRKQKPRRTNLWKAGRDTVFHHDLFARKNGLVKIKNKLKRNYHFQNPIDSVVFVDHDAPKIIEQVEIILPKTKKELRKEKRAAKKEKRKWKRWAKKNCDCDCDCNEEKPLEDKNKPLKQNDNSNNVPLKQFTVLHSVGGIGLLAFLFGLIAFWKENQM